MNKPSVRERLPYRCSECGWRAAKWVGRCGECHAWGTVEESAGAGPQRATGRQAAAHVTAPAQPVADVDAEHSRARPTGMDELDRVLGGGLVPGSVALLAGEPGVGKSTLLLEVAARCADADEPSLVVTGEESIGQVKLRAERVGALSGCLYLAAETDLGAVLGHLDAVQPRLLVVDSVQTVSSPEVEGAPGGVTQVREVTTALIRAAKERGIATLLVGHVTKEGAVAGPRALEHLVDVVLQFEGEPHSRLRMLRAMKNRFGSADEVGCFDLGEYGILGLPDPSGLFRTRLPEPVPGTCVTVGLEGKRPLVAEVQALVASSSLGTPRRTSSGVDASRVSMILAVLERRGRVSLAGTDVYTATVGGVRLVEPAVDLALAMAAFGAASDRLLPADVVVLGEVGLAGEVRRVRGVGRRLTEAARVGFRRALVPAGSGEASEGIAVTEVTDIGAAMRAVSRLSDS